MSLLDSLNAALINKDNDGIIYTVSRPVPIALVTPTKPFQKDITHYTAQTK